MHRLTWTDVKDEELMTHVASYKGRSYAEITYNSAFAGDMWINYLFPQTYVTGQRPAKGQLFSGTLKEAKRLVFKQVRKYIEELCPPTTKVTASVEKKAKVTT